MAWVWNCPEPQGPSLCAKLKVQKQGSHLSSTNFAARKASALFRAEPFVAKRRDLARRLLMTGVWH